MEPPKDASYNNLFKLLIDKNLKKTGFARNVGFVQAPLAKLSKGEHPMEVQVKNCRYLNCNLEDLVGIVHYSVEKKERDM